MREEMEKMEQELKTLASTLQTKEDALKLAETRLENRYLRTGPENCRDEPEMGIREEVVQLRQTIKDIVDKINCAKYVIATTIETNENL